MNTESFRPPSETKTSAESISAMEVSPMDSPTGMMTPPLLTFSDESGETASWTEVVPNNEDEEMMMENKDEEMESVHSTTSGIETSSGCSMESFDFEEEEEEESCVLVDPRRSISRRLDIKRLQQSIEDGADVLDRVANEEVVLVVGKTGVGKSALIQALAGKKLVETNYETTTPSGETIVTTVFETEGAPLSGFEIGHGKCSHTRHIQCFVPDQQPDGGTQYLGKRLVYLDSPGFEDTEGREVDIATTVLLTRVARVAKRLRFVILIRYASLYEDRGGAMRAVLKLVRSFVKDFDTSKKSFMFLFTHTDQNADTRGTNLCQAKEKLANQIELTQMGTNDLDILQVLGFMRMSLKKGYPFVDIFHPVHTDVAQLKKNIARLQSVDGVHLAASCGLTPPSQYKLISELQVMLHGLHAAFGGENPDLATAKSILSSFRTLERFVDVNDVHVVAQQVEEMFSQFVGHRKRCISEEVLRGSDGQHAFGVANVATIRQYVDELDELSADCGLLTGQQGGLISGIYVHVKALQERLVAKVNSTFCFGGGAIQNLYTLLVWSQGFDEFAPIYQEAILQLEVTIDGALSIVEGARDFVPFENIAKDKLEECVRCLAFLGSIVASKDRLLDHFGEKLIQAVNTFEATLEKLCSEVDEWAAQANESQIKENARLKIGVDALVDQAVTTESLYLLLGSGDMFPSSTLLRNKCGHTRLQLADAAALFLFVACSQINLNPTADYLCNLEAANVEKELVFLSGVYSAFMRVPNPKWNDCLSSYRSLVGHLASSLRNKSGELKEITKLATTQGVQNGKRDSDVLALLISYRFFDLFLPKAERFVANCVEACMRSFYERLDRITEHLDICFAKIESSTSCPVAEIQSMQILVCEETEFCHFAAVLGQQCAEAGSNTKIRLSLYTENLAARSQAELSKWNTAVSNWKPHDTSVRRGGDIASVMGNLNGIMNEVELLSTFDSGHKALMSIRSEVDNKCNEFAKTANDIFSSKYRYPAKHKYISMLVSISEANDYLSLHCCLSLPDVEEAKMTIREGIKDHARTIEQLIEETTDWDKIEELLKKLENARALDAYSSCEASSRIGALRKLQDKKIDTVDEMLDQLIDEHDYKGLAGLLLPSANSKDQVRKQNFDRSMLRISRSLEGIAGTVHRVLGAESNVSKDDLEKVSADLDKLSRASKELGEYFDRIPGGLRLGPIVEAAIKKVNHNLSESITMIIQASAGFDFVALGTHKMRADRWHSSMNPFLSDFAKRNYDRALNDFRQVPNSVESEVESFSDSFFRHDMIVSVLSSLKMASEHSAPVFVEFRELYTRTQAALEKRLREKLSSARDHMQKTDCMDIAIEMFGNLIGQLRNGLEEHLHPAFVNEIREQHAVWCTERTEMMRKATEECISSKSVATWEKRLDRMDPSSSSWIDAVKGAIKGFKSTSWSYNSLREQIYLKVKETSSRGSAALRTRDYTIAQECIAVLELMENHLSKHLTSPKREVARLKCEAVDAFDQLCNGVKMILESNSSRQEFADTFSSYRALTLGMPSVLTSDVAKRSYALVNQLIHEALSEDLTELEGWESSFDFDWLKKKIELLRLFGEYVADYVTLFHEEVKRSHHLSDEGEWLLKTYRLCSIHFSSGRCYDCMDLCAILGVPPSATKAEIKTAYRTKARTSHPDKLKTESAGGDDGALFRKIKEAFDKLSDVAPEERIQHQSFKGFLEDIHSTMRKKIRLLLSEQRYGDVETALFRLGDLHLLDNLVVPPLLTSRTRDDITKMVKSHVDRVKIEIESNWAARKYRTVNENIEDLKLMEERFKSYPEVFSASWNKGIFQSIENEIDELGLKARQYLCDQPTARKGMQEFRRCFINMGFVLYEVAPMKNYAKNVMSEVLEAFLGEQWGYSYLFDFGLSLQRSDDGCTDEENLIAQVILSEFNHFKEVLTMVWNEETLQKPVEDTVKEIKGQLRNAEAVHTLKIEDELLLNSFRQFDVEYKSLLADYLSQPENLDELVYKTVALAESMKPLSSDSGWGSDAKATLPTILAGVFATFTIQKSGESYNRVGTNGDDKIGQKLLMKPHNIQVLTLLCMFGCASSSSSKLESQLMQIRTGEGKSMILGAAAVVLGLLGFDVRCVCYSEYLSTRDYNLFRGVFEVFRITGQIIYSKITTLSEDSTAKKGNIRQLTESLLRGSLSTHSRVEYDADAPNLSCERETTQSMVVSASKKQASRNKRTGEANLSKAAERSAVTASFVKAPRHHAREQILLVDEVDVFFGPEFYGQTYNQVFQIHEPEVIIIMQQIWDARKVGGRRLRLMDIQSSQSYKVLIRKLDGFKDLIDSEISSMLSQVRQVDEVPYFVDKTNNRIGYKVMDSIDFHVTFGYRTAFAYMKEVDKGSLPSSSLSTVMAMQVSCGQFSYANIAPSRILGVSGTLSAMSEYEKNVLARYGVKKFLFVPSVYGQSNFSFDKNGEGIRVERGQSDYFHSITDQILQATKDKRSAIVFFLDNARMNEFTRSPFYPKLGRQKSLLTEEMSTADKEFVISKAATSGQITIATAVFGRGTDFFCKDDRVQGNGGVHVIQTFLSEEQSEQIQIMGRTARQGKKGSYQMILLDDDLVDRFGLQIQSIHSVSKSSLYNELDSVRDQQREKHCKIVEENLEKATATDQDTHKYFDALLAGNQRVASALFSDLYKSFKRKQMPTSLTVEIGFLVDATGSMAPYSRMMKESLQAILHGPNSIGQKLRSQFPEIQIGLKLGFIAYRDLDDDESKRFAESAWPTGDHFTEDIPSFLRGIQRALASPSGGGDIAEDHLGAIERCSKWQSANDWNGSIKFLMLLSDAPAHGMVPQAMACHSNSDNYNSRHPKGLTTTGVLGRLIQRDINLFFCSFNPAATHSTEVELAEQYLNHPDNKDGRELTSIKMVADRSTYSTALVSESMSLGHGRHIVFVLDESGSMNGHFSGVVEAYNQYLARRRQNQCDSDLISVVQFDGHARLTVDKKTLSDAPSSLPYQGGGTCFSPAANLAKSVVECAPTPYTPVVVFMSDGEANDSEMAATIFSSLNDFSRRRFNEYLELHVIAFGGGASTAQLQRIANSSPRGKLHGSAGTAELANIFVDIAGGEDVANVLRTEVGKRISDAVADRLAIEYLA